MRKLNYVLCLMVVLFFTDAMSSSAVELERINWPFSGIMGRFDYKSIQRGAHVFKEVCSACHGARLVAFRSFADIGYTPEQIKGLASQFTIRDGPNDDGEMFDRAGVPSDYWPSPFANAKAAMLANNGVEPPDLSLIVKGREGGANYIYSLLTGYVENVPKGIVIPEGAYYNLYAENNVISMAPPLSDGITDYPDGREATVANMAYDVTNFLQWASEPEMEQRKVMGIRVIMFATIMTIVLFLVKKKVWDQLKA